MGNEGSNLTIEEREWIEVLNAYVDYVCPNADSCTKSVVHNLIKIGHIKKETIIRYMTLKLYPVLLAENKGHMAAIADISVRLNVSERTVWSIVVKQR